MSELEAKAQWKATLTEYNRIIGNHLTSLRESKKIRQQTVADQIFADKSKISMIENGRATVDAEVLIAYSKALEVPIMRLLDVETDVDAGLSDYLPKVSPQYRQIAIDVLNALYHSYQRTIAPKNTSQNKPGQSRPNFSAVHFQTFNDSYDVENISNTNDITSNIEDDNLHSQSNRYVLLDHAQIDRLKNSSLKSSMEQLFNMVEQAQASIEEALKGTDK